MQRLTIFVLVSTETLDADCGNEKAFGPHQNRPDGALDSIRHRMVLRFAQERDSGGYKIQLRSWKNAEDLLKVVSIPKSDTKLLRRKTERTWF